MQTVSLAGVCADLTVVEPSNGSRIGDHPALTLPLLGPMDVTEHEPVAVRSEQGTNGELVIESSHRHPVLRLATVDGTVRNTNGTDATRPPLTVHRACSRQIVSQVVANRRRSVRHAGSGGQHSFVDRWHTGEHDVWHAVPRQQSVHFRMAENRAIARQK